MPASRGTFGFSTPLYMSVLMRHQNTGFS
jgi:hypothetical protein